MKLATEYKTRTDVMQYYIDPQFAVATLVLPAALTADRHAGDCINPTTGALTVSADTVCAVVSDFTPKGSKSVVCFYKHVILFKQGLAAADAPGLANAITLIENDPYLEFAK